MHCLALPWHQCPGSDLCVIQAQRSGFDRCDTSFEMALSDARQCKTSFATKVTLAPPHRTIGGVLDIVVLHSAPTEAHVSSKLKFKLHPSHGTWTLLGLLASLLGTRASLLGAPGLTTRSKEATRNKKRIHRGFLPHSPPACPSLCLPGVPGAAFSERMAQKCP